MNVVYISGKRASWKLVKELYGEDYMEELKAYCSDLPSFYDGNK